MVPEAATEKEPHFASQYITVTKVVFLHYFPLNIKPKLRTVSAPGTFWSSEEYFCPFFFSQSDRKVTLYPYFILPDLFVAWRLYQIHFKQKTLAVVHMRDFYLWRWGSLILVTFNSLCCMSCLLLNLLQREESNSSMFAWGTGILWVIWMG